MSLVFFLASFNKTLTRLDRKEHVLGSIHWNKFWYIIHSFVLKSVILLSLSCKQLIEIFCFILSVCISSQKSEDYENTW